MKNVQKIDLGLTGYDELFANDEERKVNKLPRIFDIPISEIDDFPDHPFKVKIDEDSLNELKIAENYAKIPIPAKCHNCCFEEACKGGVLDRRFLWYSSFSERDPYCPFRENNYLPSFKVKQVSNDVKSIHQDYLPTMFFANNEKFSEK